MKTLMSRTERLFATTLLEAESLVEEARKTHGTNVKQHIIAKRTKQEVDFYIVTITIEIYKINDLVITE